MPKAPRQAKHSQDPHPYRQTRTLDLIEATLRDGKTDRMLSLSTEDAQVALDEAWDVLGSSLACEWQNEHSPSLYGSPTCRSILRRISVKLALKHNILPTSMFLQNVRRLESDYRHGGSFADVYYAELDGVPVALKRIRLFSTTSEEEKREKMKALHCETLLWKGLSHPNVVSFIGVSDVFAGTICMVLSWRPKTIRQHRSSCQADGFLSDPEQFARLVNGWISLGLAYLHEEGVIHGDLHGGNILVDEEGNPQLTDFGMAVIADAMPYGYHSMHGGGAVRWTAPELLDPEPFNLTSRRPTPSSDVYSFGCLSIEIYTGEKPFPALGDFQVHTRVLDGERPPRPTPLGGGPMADDVWNLIKSCWASKPQSRPRSRDVSRKLGKLFAPDFGSDPPSPDSILILSPAYKVVESEGGQSVMDCAVSDNYLAILIRGTRNMVQVYSLQDLSCQGTLNLPYSQETNQLAVAGDMLAVYTPLVMGSLESTIRIWDLPGRLCGRFIESARGVQVVAVTRKATDANPGLTVSKERPTFIVYSKYFGYLPGLSQYRIGALSPPHESLEAARSTVPLRESCHYKNFSCPEEAFPLSAVIAQGGYAIASCKDSMIRRWDILNGDCTQVIETRGCVNDLSIDPLSGMACARMETLLVVWDANIPLDPPTRSSTFPEKNMSGVVAHSNHIIWKDSLGNVHIWTHDFTESRTLSHQTEPIKRTHCAGRSIMTISRSKVKVWDIWTCAELQTFDFGSDYWEGVDTRVWQAQFLYLASNDRFLAVRRGPQHSKLYLWRFEDREP